MRFDRKITTLSAAIAAAAFVMTAASSASAQQKGTFDANGHGVLGWAVDGGGRIIPVAISPAPASTAKAKATKRR